jgi:hypothetical protein
MNTKQRLAAATVAALVLALPAWTLAAPIPPSINPESPAPSAPKEPVITLPAILPGGGSGDVAPAIPAKPAEPAAPGTGGSLPGTGPIDQSGQVSASGVLTYVTDLETPHYEVSGWAIAMNSAALPKLVGKSVTVTGKLSGGISILMKPQILVSEMQVTLEGTLTLVADVESPHYELAGFVLKSADTASLESLSGQTVAVTGLLAADSSIYMKPVIDVREAWAAGTRLPSLVVVRGHAPAFPTASRVVDGHLMLPLRAVVEAAGGNVGWDAEAMAVRIALEGRFALIRIGQTAYSNGELPVAPFLADDCTLAPVELLTDLGLVQRWEGPILSFDLAASRGAAVQ